MKDVEPVRVRAAMGLLVCSFVFLQSARADSLSAAEIVERAQRSNTFRYEAARTRVRMVLTAADGKRRERALEVVGRKKDGGYQSLVRFIAPEDVAGTAFLLIDRGAGSEQYVYLPGVKRTRRIVGRERDGSFVNSDFTYGDLRGVDPRQAKHARLADENIGSDPCYVIESAPEPAAEVSYGKVVTWVRQSDFIALRTRFYDRANTLVKTLYSRRIRMVDGAPRVVEARMQNERTRHTTELWVDVIENRTDLTDAQFTPTALEHL